MQGYLTQEDLEGGGKGPRVEEDRPQLSFKEEQLINEVRHEKVVVDKLWEIVEQLLLHFLKETTGKLHLRGMRGIAVMKLCSGFLSSLSTAYPCICLAEHRVVQEWL